MWLLFAVLAGTFFSGSSLVTRHILKGKQDAWAYSFFYSTIGALISLPVVLLDNSFGNGDFEFPLELKPWLIIVVVGCAIVLHNYLQFKSTNYIPASLQGVITKLRLVWIFAFALVFLGEDYSNWKLIGTLLTVISGVVLIGRFKTKGSLIGILMSVAATLVFASTIMFYKILFDYFSAAELTFLIFVVPAVLNLIIMPTAGTRIANLFRLQPMFILLGCGFGAFANIFMNYALSLGEASRVPAMIEAFLVLTLAGEYIILKERSGLFSKLFAVTLATIGAVAIRLG